MGTQPLPQKGRSPTQFSAHVYCGQTAAWIKMPLGTEVGLGLRDIVFDVDPATPRKRHTHPYPIFWPMSIVATVAHLSYCWALVAFSEFSHVLSGFDL